jgi:RHS repeat-associated protein
MTVSGQSQISYGYDNADRLTSITQGSANVGFTYDSADRRTVLTLPNGVTVESAYDAASQLTGLTYKLGSNTLGNLTYTYDEAGNRLTTGGSWARTGLPAAVASATYDAANQIATWGSTSFTYDNNGNLTNDGSKTYTWNTRNQLTSSTGPLSGSFAYDGLWRRRAKTIAGTTTQFLYDGLNPVQELNGGGAAANLLTGLGIDQFLTRSDADGVRSYLTDILGNTLALADGSGTVQTEYKYEPFGGTTTTGASTTNALAFTGREVDGMGTGLYYYRGRYYDPQLHRFLSEDPINFEGGDFNLHAYAGNSPTNFVDPRGTNSVVALPLPTPIIGSGISVPVIAGAAAASAAVWCAFDPRCRRHAECAAKWIRDVARCVGDGLKCPDEDKLAECIRAAAESYRRCLHGSPEVIPGGRYGHPPNTRPRPSPEGYPRPAPRRP